MLNEDVVEAMADRLSEPLAAFTLAYNEGGAQELDYWLGWFEQFLADAKTVKHFVGPATCPHCVREEAVTLAGNFLRAHMPTVISACEPLIQNDEREECAKIGVALLRPQQLQLQAGEMTAQEARTAKAVVRYMISAIRQRSASLQSTGE